MKIFLAIILVILAAIVAFSSSSYAKDSLCDYRSYTMAMKMCDTKSECLMQDFVIECCGNRVTNITSIGNFMPVDKDHRESSLGWCE